ncbi:SDR family oxidoreductase [Vannielia litorea]|uniref:SDR family oxidoreductase n=1 Tax=Vannielia litorea TaxID=1217970 RepID=UPI001C9834EC|nr:SDR family oxidoreductase [Vannielia litorea]MBY6153889.1 SDR family oxidoreductase [Vannielia litorea]
MTKTHANTHALIIGGTQGLGRAIAEQLVAEGCTNLVIASRNVPRGEAVAEEIGATFMPVDLLDTAATVDLVEKAAAHMGRLDALVNSAALTDRGTVLDTSPELWDRLMTANARSPYFALQRMAQLAIEAGHPASVVNILSIVVHGGQSFLSPYAASKALMVNVTKNAASTLSHHRIRVNGINCGWMDTPGEDEIQRKYHDGGDDWLEKAEARMPFGMLVKTPHVAHLASYLLSENAGVMTGACIDFDQVVPGMYPE